MNKHDYEALPSGTILTVIEPFYCEAINYLTLGVVSNGNFKKGTQFVVVPSTSDSDTINWVTTKLLINNELVDNALGVDNAYWIRIDKYLLPGYLSVTLPDAYCTDVSSTVY